MSDHDWSDIVDKALACKRFSQATVRYWVEWLDSREQYPPTAEAFIKFIDKMEYSVGESLSDMIPDDFIQENDDE